MSGSKKAAHPLRILIVDDNCDSADSFAILLEMSGHQVSVAYSGMEALAAAQAFNPHLAILDIGMPDLSGYEVAARLRDSEWGRDIKRIAVTGWGIDDIAQGELNGFHHHLVKPLDFGKLTSLIEEVGADLSR